MKKGLLTVLLASLVLVGCQNYDDQFDDLNAQISALKSQVDGLSALSGQVSSLSGTISGLQSGISAAQASASSAAAAAGAIDLSGLSASLTALQAEVDAIEAAIATTATAAEVAALQTSLTAVETDLADLLTSNNIYSTDVTISDAASMASALALGNKVALVNATVTITDASTVSDTDLQTFINRIKTMNGNFVYDSGSTTGAAPTFDEMVSAKAITITQAGDISFKKLAGATTIQINDDYETKITSVDFGALASLTAFNDDGTTANKINLTNATNVDLASLTRHTSTSSLPFTIITKKGATLDLSAFDDISVAGAQEDLYMELNGPASYTATNIADGDMGMTNVATVSVSNFFGTLDVDAGVETLTVVDGHDIDMTGSSDLKTATLDFAYDYDPALSTANAAIAAAGYSSTYTEDLDDGRIDFSDLETLTVTGNLLDLYIDGAELITLSIDATMHDLTISSATDLTTLTVASGSKIGNISLSGTTNLAVADFNHTTNLTDTDATAQKSVTFYADSNTALTKLHSTGDDVDTLTITNNAALAELDFTGLADDGAETTASAGGVTVWGNALVATSASNTTDGDTNRADGLATDLGSFDDGTSGMDTLKTYLTHIAATSNSVAFVTFDTLQTETDTETTGVSTVTLNVSDGGDGSTTNEATVLKMTAAATSNAVAGSDATKAKRAFTFAAAGGKLILDNGSGIVIPASPATGLVMTGNNAVDAAAITVAANTDRATALGFTLSANDDGAASLQVSLQDYSGNNDQGTAAGERYTTNADMAAASTDTAGTGGGIPIFSTDPADLFTFSVGTNSVQVSTAGYGGTATTLAQIEAVILNAWALKYGDGGTASASALATLVGRGTGFINVYSRQTDSGGAGLAVAMDVTNVLNSTTVNSGTSSNIDYVIGATKDTGDNSTVGSTTFSGLVISIESNTAGSDLNAVSAVVDESGGQSLTEMTTAYRSATGNTWASELYAATDDNRTDVRSPEQAVADTANTAAAATTFNRVAWLG